MAQRWTDDMLDRQAEQLAETRALLNDLLDGQRMLVQIYQQEHEARVEADRRFNRFIEEQQQINREQQQINGRLASAVEELRRTVEELRRTVEELRRLVRFSRENGSSN